ncbi:DUF2635 domain-containing protein [Pseudomonas alliivorans]|uniref:DUF2635 domain-containing protein n=1 Tax=Pseudomonas alliivorans TaxID=2810613 RepID=A0ABS4C630_9PSED|nr:MULTISPECIES: DUF2635 domain-containing protein [Pseudomonas]MBP0942094.1 DUF2635 domain-containing protein [Pseudomonas alliivorans]MBP0946120.1 DUF2635 domain-containing protein [Pseudomonas alliivorans]MCO5364166.1 DUF2635 domain-containing protein [Pseudomonas alliivorans]MEE4310072.1 DUF2635 domain-containing protein [Pseudomonas alliivorans]MEE4326645.1 DUF2635 domain-containing protein [Pseudomonas alliivorans]
MTQRITVLPAEGRTVPDPEAGDLLPAEGRTVTFNAWWQRRHNDGDITFQTEQSPTQSAETA